MAGRLSDLGDYRVWLLPDFATDTLERRGMVFHGGKKTNSAGGVREGDDIIDFSIGRVATGDGEDCIEMWLWVGKRGKEEVKRKQEIVFSI